MRYYRKAILADAAWIAALCHQQFQVAHEEAIQADDLLYLVNKVFTPEAVLEDMQQAAHYYFVVMDENIPAGCVRLSTPELALAIATPGAIELGRFYVWPAYIGKGIGALLMEACVSFVQQHSSYNSIWLHVYERNFTAQSFYTKKGFIKAGEQLYPVRDSCPNGWVMMRMIN